MYPKKSLLDLLLNYVEGAPGDDNSGGSGDAGGNGGSNDNGGSSDNGAKDDDKDTSLNEHGYPKNTAIQDMTPEQQAAYWKYHSRKNENLLKASVPKDRFDEVQSELDKVRRESLSEAEKAQEDAKRAGYQEALQKLGPRLVHQTLKAAVAGRVDDDRIKEYLEFVDVTKFLDKNGDVDTDKVERFAEGIAPANDIPDRTGWKSSRGNGVDRERPRSGAHSVASAKEEHKAKLQQSRK